VDSHAQSKDPYPLHIAGPYMGFPPSARVGRTLPSAAVDLASDVAPDVASDLALDFDFDEN